MLACVTNFSIRMQSIIRFKWRANFTRYNFLSKNLVKAKSKQYLSPRLSIAYPITEQGVIRFSYGHFYQFEIYLQFIQIQIFALRTEFVQFWKCRCETAKSVQYEIGLQQGLTSDLRLK